MTTTETTTPTPTRPFEDQLETLSWHLRANPQLPAVANIRPSRTHLDIQLWTHSHVAELTQWGLTLTAVTVAVMAIKEKWFVDVCGTMADVPVRVWTCWDVQDGDTQLTVAAGLTEKLSSVLAVGDAPVEA